MTATAAVSRDPSRRHDPRDGRPDLPPPPPPDDSAGRVENKKSPSGVVAVGDNLGWAVPARTWQEFTAYVDAEYGEAVDPTADDPDRIATTAEYGRQLQAALEEYVGFRQDTDRAEAILRDLADVETDRYRGPSDLHDQETETVYNRVNARVKDAVASWASRADTRPGIVVARALEEYLDGGVVSRLTRGLERLEAALEDADADVTQAAQDDTDASSDQQDAETDTQDPTGVDEKVAAICDRLDEGGTFTTDWLDDQIDEIAASGPKASDPTRRKYRDLVLERLDYRRNPLADADVWCPAEVARDLAPDGVPEVCWRPVDRLEKKERVERVRLEAARLAAERTEGEVEVHRDTVREDFLDAEVTARTAKDYLKAAATVHGFEATTMGRDQAPALSVDLIEVANGARPDLFHDAVDYRDAQKDQDRDATLGDFAPDDGPDLEERAASADAGPTAGTAATDGGDETDAAADAADAELDAILGGDTVDPDDDPLDDVENDMRPDAAAERRYQEGE